MITDPHYLNWRHVLRDTLQQSIEHDFVLLDNPVLDNIPQAPFKVNVTTVILCHRGCVSGRISLQPFEACAPSLIVLLPDRILELERVSADFQARVLIMSARFTDNLLTDAHDRLHLSRSADTRPCLPLTPEALAGLDNYFSMMKRAAAMTDNPDRLAVAHHLMLAFLYGTRTYFHPQARKHLSHREAITERFLTLARQDYRRERQLSHYADRLCLTAKYLAQVVKETTGTTANAHIDAYVMLEAKALLKSTDMTIQQIGYALNFENASFFAKYFKRHLGLSPRQYRDSPTAH